MHAHSIFEFCAIPHDAFVLVIKPAFSNWPSPNVIPECTPNSLDKISWEMGADLHVMIMVRINSYIPFVVNCIVLREVRNPQKARQANANMFNALNYR